MTSQSMLIGGVNPNPNGCEPTINFQRNPFYKILVQLWLWQSTNVHSRVFFGKIFFM